MLLSGIALTRLRLGFFTILPILLTGGPLRAAGCTNASSGRDVVGIVIDPTGAGLEKMTVELFQKAEKDACGTAKSDRDGRFRLPSVSIGNYRLLARGGGFVQREVELVVSIAPGAPIDLGKIRLNPKGCDSPEIICDEVKPERALEFAGEPRVAARDERAQVPPGQPAVAP